MSQTDVFWHISQKPSLLNKIQTGGKEFGLIRSIIVYLFGHFCVVDLIGVFIFIAISMLLLSKLFSPDTTGKIRPNLI